MRGGREAKVPMAKAELAHSRDSLSQVPPKKVEEEEVCDDSTSIPGCKSLVAARPLNGHDEEGR